MCGLLTSSIHLSINLLAQFCVKSFVINVSKSTEVKNGERGKSKRLTVHKLSLLSSLLSIFLSSLPSSLYKLIQFARSRSNFFLPPNFSLCVISFHFFLLFSQLVSELISLKTAKATQLMFKLQTREILF